MKNYSLLINGKWKCYENLNKIYISNPATGETLGSVPDLNETEIKKAIDSSEKAFRSWANTTASEKSLLLRNLFNLILEQKNDIAEIMTLEQGKPLSEALSEVIYAASFVEWYSEEAKRVYGETIPSWKKNNRIVVIKQPVGIVAAITPWNFPAAMVTRKIAPALASGCTVILKPAPETPLTAIKIFELIEKAGFPEGVANIITSKAELFGNVIMNDKRVRKISFTGSTNVGKLLMKQSSNDLKRISLELGGQAPFIVFDDADIDLAVKQALASKFRNCGQTCIASNRFYVQENIKSLFIKKLKKEISTLKIGNGMDENVKIGPLINKQGFNKVMDHINDALSKGAIIEYGGKPLQKNESDNFGFFIEPTLLSNINSKMKVSNEETFGPVIPIITFKDENEVIEMANNSDYGLASYIFTQSLSRGIKISEKLEYGIVGLNDGLPSSAQIPFGGFKESSIGREGGHYGIEEFLEIKYISIGI